MICDECGEEIDPPETAVRMARVDPDAELPDGGRRLVFHYHLECAPEELVGVWERVN